MTADDYLRDVSFQLRDLPWRTRRDLIAELEVHISELPTGTSLRGRLGTPAEYAADMRAAAGLDRRHGPIAFLLGRRPRNLFITVVVLAAIGFGIGAVVWIHSYQPLALGNGFQNPPGAIQEPAGSGEYVVFHQGQPFEFGITLRNSGSFSVRVLGVPFASGVVSVRPRMSGPINGGFPQDLPRFRPFDLKPGEERALVLNGVYKARCAYWPPGGSTSIVDFPIRYSFLWKTETTYLRLPWELGIVFRKGSCPTP
jgi:hypothetical protein